MEAYAILAGGGVKGIALAGCLAAAQDKGVDFAGYGGTSAGSIVALLGSVGYTGHEIRELLGQQSFTTFLDDGGIELERLKTLAKFVFEDKRLKSVRLAKRIFSERALIKRLYTQAGLYSASNLESFLKEKVRARYPRLTENFKFSELHEAGGRHLKVVAADIVARQSLTFSKNSTTTESDWPVIAAIRASMSYPFVFRPVRMHTNYLTDGGITSNLPVFLFEKERKSHNLPVMAFDLIVPSTQTSGNENYKLFKFSEDMLMTTMESSDKLLQGLITGLHYIPVRVPAGIDTLKFSLSQEEQIELFEAGYTAAKQYLENDVRHWFERSGSRITELQAQRPVRPDTVEGLLSVIAKDFELNTKATAVRCSIMMPTGEDTQIVIYQYGMTGHPDAEFQIKLTSGWSGKAYSLRRVVAVDLAAAQWGLSLSERAKIPDDRKAALSIPLFDVSSSIDGRINSISDRLLGTLNVDTNCELLASHWGTLSTTPGPSFELNDIVRNRCLLWGELLSRLLS